MTFSQRDLQTGQVVQKLNALGAGGGGSAPFSVEDLDLEAYADKVPSLMQLTSDVDQIIEGTASVGAVKASEPTPLVFQYADYVLTEAENMILGANATFLPDVTQNPIAYCNGKIDMIADNDYLLTFGDQQYSDISFRNDTDQPIDVKISIEGGSIRNKAYVDDVLISDLMSTYNTGGPIVGSSFIVPAGSTYKIDASGGVLHV